MSINVDQNKYSSQNIDNMSFDEGLGVKVVEIVGSNGELKNLASVTDEQPVYDEGNNQALTRLLEQVTQPLWYDATNNRLYVSSTIVGGTLPTVTVVTGLTNIGGVPASSVVDDLSGVKWANCVRNLLT